MVTTSAPPPLIIMSRSSPCVSVSNSSKYALEDADASDGTAHNPSSPDEGPRSSNVPTLSPPLPPTLLLPPALSPLSPKSTFPAPSLRPMSEDGGSKRVFVGDAGNSSSFGSAGRLSLRVCKDFVLANHCQHTIRNNEKKTKQNTGIENKEDATYTFTRTHTHTRARTHTNARTHARTHTHTL